MRTFLRENALTLFFIGLLLLALVGQAASGLAEFNSQQVSSGQDAIPLGAYLVSSDFAADVAENWQSEFLQFFLYILATVWFVQKGSSESKEPGHGGLGTDEEQRVGPYADARSPAWARARGWRLHVYANSLGLVMGVIFLLCWLAESVAGRAAYNAEQLRGYEDPVTWLGYLGSADFWSRTLQNWQSEFLAVAAMASFAVYLRQRGSPESKPVGTPHDSTGDEG